MFKFSINNRSHECDINSKNIIIRVMKTSKKSLELIDKIEENVFKLKSNFKQSKITDYYNKNALN